MKKLLFILLISSINLFAQNNKVNVILNDSITLILEKSDFCMGNQKVDYYQNYIVGINGDIVFGTDGEIPKSKLTTAELKVGKKIYELEIDGMYNPWFGNGINENLFVFENKNGQIKIGGIFSDGAGTYGAEWLIYKDSSIRTILSKDEKITIEYFQN